MRQDTNDTNKTCIIQLAGESQMTAAQTKEHEEKKYTRERKEKILN